MASAASSELLAAPAATAAVCAICAFATLNWAFASASCSSSGAWAGSGVSGAAGKGASAGAGGVVFGRPSSSVDWASLFGGRVRGCIPALVSAHAALITMIVIRLFIRILIILSLLTVLTH